ncbi:hypothetical protein [Rickettsia montanensis]|uniref:ComEC/Rec2-like protein n=1 Tax=Rickettsia montanensis (strain OSU 85-930) TaxID=1105114 RepID=H8KB30_RICMS|nr:hypothetical protein [Rickettsia montanensis]AFC73696.1 ComEC/Rec2-like protein [Rickettsia montanensis str. OSU 85-930]
MIIAFIFGIFISRVTNLHSEMLYKPIITKISGKIESIKPTIIRRISSIKSHKDRKNRKN